MKKLFPAAVLLLLFIIFLPAQAQQLMLEWAKRYNGTDSTSLSEHAVAVAVDAAGNSYVTGTSHTTRFTRIATVAYAPSGQQLWAVEHEENATVTDIAVDNTGGVYVIGSSNGDYLTIRYNAATGEQIWVQYYDGGEADEATDIVIDNAGGVYITGHSNGGFATVRYNAATGEMEWEQHYDGDTTDRVADIAVDDAGGVYITGTSDNDYVTIRYDAATGEQTWVQHYNGPGGMDIASAIAVDNDGGVYVTGSSTGNYYMNSHFATIRYDAATGEQTWVQRISDEANYTVEHAADIAVDNAGSVYVTGSKSTIRGGDVALTIAYATATGEERWAQSYQGPAIDIDVSAIAVDNAGGIYITGSSLNNASDYVTIRYNAVTGEQTWVQHYGAIQDSDDKAVDIAVDENGGVYVTGSSIGQTFTYNYATVRYTASTGEQSWVQQYAGGTIGNADDYTIAVAVDAEGNSYITGTSVGEQSYKITTVKYSPSGEELWAVQLEDNTDAVSIAVDNAGGVYVTGTRSGNMGVNFITVRYDAATGEETWTRDYSNGGGTNFATAIAVDNTGGVYVTGYSLGSSPVLTAYATVRYEAATGEETWTSLYYSSGPSFATDIAVDNAGGVYVTGSSFDSRYGFSEYATVRYDAATGEEVWARRYTNPNNMNNQATAITVDNTAGVYVTGSSYNSSNNNDYATVRYEAATGTETWVRLYNGPAEANDVPVDVAVDNSGGVYVTGTSGGSASSDFATIRYEAVSGEETWVQRYNESESSLERAAAIDVDKGNVYVTGYSTSDNTRMGSEYTTVRYVAPTGEQIWAERYAESTDNVNMAVDIATDGMGNIIVTGYSFSPATGNDFLTIKYSQQADCPDIIDAVITGPTAVQAGTTGSTYSLPNTGAGSFSWIITDSQGNPYTNFTGQGTNSITVSWPSAPDFFQMSVSSGGPGGGCVGSTSVTYVSVFDPDAGFVTGGGWMDSPASSDYEFMQTGRRVHLNLVARYGKRKGEESQVQGTTSLLLQAGSFTFRSTSYEPGSLVITGNRAYYSGRGTVTYREGAGRPVSDEKQYGFLVAATDGDLGEGAGEDRFRLSIWEINADGSQGPVVYDTQAGCPSASLDENAAACTALGGGNITIHKPKSMARKQAVAALAEQELRVYPTAASDRAMVSFSLEYAGGYTLDLYDMKGSLVKRVATGQAEAGKHYEQEILVGELGKGLYLARLTTKEKVQTVKLLVQR